MSPKTYDVVIAGAGPVGLLLACELRLAGDVSVLILERDADDTKSPWKTRPLGVRGLNQVAAEALYRRGLLEEVIDQEMLRMMMPKIRHGGKKFVGHFAGMMIDGDKVDQTRPAWKYHLSKDSQPSMTTLERIASKLHKHAESLGVDCRKSVEVTGITQDDEQQETVVHTANGESFRGKWLVGCDGAHSVIRKAAGFDFVGNEPALTGYIALCDMEDPQQRLLPGFQRTPRGIYVSLGGGHTAVLEGDSSFSIDRTKPLKEEDLQAPLRRISGVDDLTVKKLHTASVVTDRSKQTTTYRKGRVLLAGDSCHIHSPLGGQGLNLGIGDAINLGWKLAAVVKGTAPEDLLDTYTSERHPTGANVLDWSRAQVSTMRSDLHSQATAKLIKTFVESNEGASYMYERVSGVANRYDLSLGDDEELHPLVGRSAPDFEFNDGSGKLGGKMWSGRGLIVDFGDDDRVALSQLAQGWHSKVDYVGAHAKNELGLRALLVRPDGIVAWVAEGEPELETAKAALTRWFGARSEA